MEKAKLMLLAHSTNMLNAAQSNDWEAFSALESQWQAMLESAIDEHGEALDVIGPQLMEDNRQILASIKCAQKEIASEMQKNTQAASSVKQYLK